MGHTVIIHFETGDVVRIIDQNNMYDSNYVEDEHLGNCGIVIRRTVYGWYVVQFVDFVCDAYHPDWLKKVEEV